MKAMKKLLCLALVLTMLAALSVTAMAATTTTTSTTESGDGDFTITMSSTAGHTYTAYQIFAGDLLVTTTVDDKDTEDTSDDTTTVEKTLSNITWGDGVDSANLMAELAGFAHPNSSGNIFKPFRESMTAREVAEVLATLSAADVEAVASIIAQFVTDGTSGTTAITGLEAGYYLVVDTTEADDMPAGDTYSKFMLEVVGDVTVKAKDSSVEVDKKVKDINDSTSTTASIDTTDTADWDIGDTISYEIMGTLPDWFDSYDVYDFIYYFEDTLSAGLTYNNDAVIKIYADRAAYEAGTVSATLPVARDGSEDFDEIVGARDADGNQTIRWGCDHLESLVADVTISSKNILVVSYTCTLNEDAVVGVEGNPNTLRLQYSNDPNSFSTGYTPYDIVTVFTFELDVYKVDGDDNPLAGAKFTLYKLKSDGKTHIDPFGIIDPVTGQVIPAPVMRYGDEWIEIAEIEATASGGKYVASYKGIDDGVYMLKETVTPPGFNTASPIYFEVVAAHSENADQSTNLSVTIYDGTIKERQSSGGTGGPSTHGQEFKDPKYTFTRGELSTSFTVDTTTQNISTTIKNQPGSVLPSTGGIGTTIFYVIGSILVIGAGAVLVARRRTDKEC